MPIADPQRRRRAVMGAEPDKRGVETMNHDRRKRPEVRRLYEFALRTGRDQLPPRFRRWRIRRVWNLRRFGRGRRGRRRRRVNQIAADQQQRLQNSEARPERTPQAANTRAVVCLRQGHRLTTVRPVRRRPRRPRRQSRWDTTPAAASLTSSERRVPDFPE